VGIGYLGLWNIYVTDGMASLPCLIWVLRVLLGCRESRYLVSLLDVGCVKCPSTEAQKIYTILSRSTGPFAFISRLSTACRVLLHLRKRHRFNPSSSGLRLTVTISPYSMALHVAQLLPRVCSQHVGMAPANKPGTKHRWCGMPDNRRSNKPCCCHDQSLKEQRYDQPLSAGHPITECPTDSILNQ